MYAPEVDRGEMLRYAGFAGGEPDEATARRAGAMTGVCLREARPAWRYALLDLAFDGGTPVLDGTPLPGRDIARHLQGAQRCAMMAVTLGLGAERALRAMQQRSMADALLLDAAMSACVESAADACCRDIAHDAGASGLYVGARFSPGYGDLPLSMQRAFERALDMRRTLGISMTDGCLLIPQKSVTAFVGLYPQRPSRAEGGCDLCPARDNCAYRRTGGACSRPGRSDSREGEC